MKAPKSTERVNKMRADAKAKGWRRREYYATETEHARLADCLQKLRGKKQ